MTRDELQNIPREALESICWGLAVRLGFHWVPEAPPEQVMDVMVEAHRSDTQTWVDNAWQRPAKEHPCSTSAT
ncbi:MAG: hypothetical protein ABFE13_11995 [Phycisphaerales bacterium]